MKLLYTNENPALVGYVKEIVENEGFEVSLKNEFTSAGMGPPYNIWLELWLVNDADYDQARNLVESVTSADVQNRPD